MLLEDASRWQSTPRDAPPARLSRACSGDRRSASRLRPRSRRRLVIHRPVAVSAACPSRSIRWQGVASGANGPRETIHTIAKPLPRRDLARLARVVASAALCSVLLLVPTASRADIEAAAVQQAIERGTDWLKNQQRPNGSWPEWTGFRGGVSALSTLALLHAGVPTDDPVIQKALEHLRSFESNRTYVVSLQTMVFAMAEPERDAWLIRRNVRLLESWQIKQGPNRGAWSYGGPASGPGGRAGGTGDNSNAQFAVLALHEAERVGVPVSQHTWKAVLAYWTQAQNPNGSWGYQPHAEGRGSMTCAGIASLTIAREKLSDGDARVSGQRVRCCQSPERDDAIERALDWLGRNFSVYSHPGYASWLLYYLYGVERAGRLTARRFFGTADNQHDWYREGAEMLVRAQDKLSGFWRGRGHGEENPLIGTSFALLFLAKGRRPVLLSKIQHDGPDWNAHRSDALNLTRYVETRWHRPLSWQIIDLQAATVDDLLQSPVLYLSGREQPVFTDQQVRSLREYIDRGGFLFAVGCCDDARFDKGFRRLVARMFPEPEYRLRLLEPDHPIWRAEETVDPQYIKPLWGIDVGCRTSVVYSPLDLSCFWELARPGRQRGYPRAVRDEMQAALALGINVLAYATNREVRYKDDLWQTQAGRLPQDNNAPRAALHIAKLRHTGGWNRAPQALANLSRILIREKGIRVALERHDLALTDPRLFDHAIAFMHGQSAFSFTPAEREALRSFVERGGVLIADSICGNDAFVRSFRREMKLVFPDAPLQRVPPDHAMFTPKFGGFDVTKLHRRRPQRTDAGPLKIVQQELPPELEGVRIGDRYGVLFSRYDISCALEHHESLQCSGYARDDAARLAVNLVLYAIHE